MKLEITKNPPTTIKKIKSYEKEFNISLPKEYKEFLLEYNGGEVKSKTCIKPIYGGTLLFMHEFFSIEHIFDCLKFSMEVYKTELDSYYPDMELFKKNHLLIGHTMMGYDLSICFKGIGIDEIFYSFLLEDIDLVPVSDSFNEFINGFDYEENL